MPGLTTKRFRKALHALEVLVEENPTVAAAIRDRLRPQMEHRAEEFYNEAAMAKITASCPDVEVALREMAEWMDSGSEALARDIRAFERSVGLRAARRPALWKRTKDEAA